MLIDLVLSGDNAAVIGLAYAISQEYSEKRQCLLEQEEQFFCELLLLSKLLFYYLLFYYYLT